MEMVGLEAVKARFLEVTDTIETAKRQAERIRDGGDDSGYRSAKAAFSSGFHAAFIGNPGTGKTTVGRLYAKFLASQDMIPDNDNGGFVKTAGASLLRGSVKAIKDFLQPLDDGYRSTGGVAFIDRPQALAVDDGRETVDYLVHEMDRMQEKVAFVFAGPKKDIETFLGFDARLRLRVQFDFKFDDFQDTEILQRQIREQYGGKMRVEMGHDGLEFGNVREVAAAMKQIRARQATRLAQDNYERELDEQPPVRVSLNKLFLGSPGTGKTTVAKYYGQILADIGLLSRGEVLVKNPADFIGQAIGESEQKTKAILDAAKGNVLIIDEAYGLSAASSGGGAGDDLTGHAADSYKTAVIDTLVAEVQGTSGEDRCVLLLGYKDGMEKLFQSVNPALRRRFPWSSAFEFEDYTDDELRLILGMKLKKDGFRATERAEEAAMEVLRRSRNHRNFGNAGEVDILLSRAKDNQQKRLAKDGGPKDPYLFEPQDIDPDFDRLDRAGVSIRKVFEDFVGMEDLIAKLEGYQRIVQNSKDLDSDAQRLIPFNFLFRGPPGIGKTTLATKMGQIFYAMGFLATPTVEHCSTSHLIGEALGKVLFTDEAYCLADSSFGRDALAEVAAILTRPRYRNKLVTILAGYEDDIDRLMAVNPGLTSRFPEVVDFPSLGPAECCELLFKRIKALQGGVDLAPVLEGGGGGAVERICRVFGQLARLPAWGNGRDVETLAENVVAHMMRSRAPTLVLTEEIVVGQMEALRKERAKRAGRRASYLHVPAYSKGPGGHGRDDSPESVQDQDRTATSAPSLGVHSHNVNVNTTSRIQELSDDDDDEDEEDKMREFLEMSELCPYGYIWKRVTGGWECEGGAHSMTDDDVRREMGRS
ncbi:P-loop containing nucleoside triphosphate hydrolase protein [Achaetomium macrosporum]|uniref:P-loop containing nucleoside triphosphate hydrolase protein n=1 Tax=Achaetomium macrosporum TaxID=79813 RepID=A0AAN7HFB3_9PEZI|nr:P-loop containing nucleoside triphosphate hydrolase protein [Achaetomium macrosporum]